MNLKKIFKNKKIEKFIVVLLLLLILFSQCFPVFAKVDINSAIVSAKRLDTSSGYVSADSHIYWYSETYGGYIDPAVTYVEYVHPNGNRYPAYCIEEYKPGVGLTEQPSYAVTINSMMNDQRIWRVLKNGYPYQTSSQMGVENWHDAYMATRYALYCIIGGYDVEQRVKAMDTAGQKIKECIKRLVNIGRTGTETYKEASANVTKSGELITEVINGIKYKVQRYNVSSDFNIKQYDVNIAGFPNGTKIYGIDNIERSTFSTNNFRIAIPISEIKNDVEGVIRIANIQLKTYPVLYANAPRDDWQDYVLLRDPYETFDTGIELKFDTAKSSISVTKKDIETGSYIANTIFTVYNSSGVAVGTITTDVNGNGTLENLKPDTYTVKETKANDDYIATTESKNVNLGYEERKTIDFTNAHKKGNLKIVKIDKDTKVGIEGVKFELYSEKDNNLVGTYITDSSGEIYIENLRVGNYILKEISTGKNYVLNDTPYNIEITYNTTTTETLENEYQKGNLKVVKIDKDTKVEIEGVKFELYSKNDNSLIGTYVTDSNGEIYIENLRVGNYTLKEISTGKNYILNSTVHDIEIKYNETTIKNIENERKKGNLKIYKVDFDNEKIPIPDVEFEITDSEGNKYTGITDENGEVFIENIRTGIVSVKETKTNSLYKLSDETFEVEIRWNETSEITIKNEKLKGQIEVYKVDAEDNKIKIEGVEFEVINSNNEVVEKLVTDKKGYAKTSYLPIGKYRLKETKTDNMHILKDDIVSVEILADAVSKVDIENERIKGKIKIVKTSEDDNFINGEKTGTPIVNVKFEIYDIDRKVVDRVVTDKEGIAITRLLDKGIYYIKEVESGEWYLLNENAFTTEIKTHNEIVEVEVTNESEKPDVDIEKVGIIQTTANQEIKYDFKIKNTGNVRLNDFTWYDYLPTEYVRITKLITGTYNQDLDYSIYYKTNKNDYRLLKDNLNTQVNNYIDFSNLKLEDGEYVTEFKTEFGTVDIGFESVIDPYIFVKVNNNVKNNDVFINETRIEGYNKTFLVWDEDDHETTVYEKKLEIKLPKTGC